MSDIIVKKSMFSRFADGFKKMFSREKVTHEITHQIYSKFRDYISSMEEDDPSYENAYMAADFCEEALQTARKRLSLVDRIKSRQEKITELDAYLKLSEDDATKIKNLLNSYVSLTKERTDLIYRLTGFDKSLPRLETLISDANNAIPDIQNAEKNHKILRQDIGYLQGEREDLVFEREKIEKSLDFIEKFRLGSVIVFFLGVFALTYLYVGTDIVILVPASLLLMLIIITIPLLYLFKKRMRFELKLNISKQRKAVSMLNTKNTVFVYYTNFLNYEYKKYRVRNSSALKANIKDYENYTHIINRIDSLRRTMYVTETEITKFLRENSITNKFSVEQFAHTVNIGDKLEFSRELINEKALLDKDLAELDERHQDIWDKLEALIENDISPDRIISQLTQLYFDEVDKLVFVDDEPKQA